MSGTSLLIRLSVLSIVTVVGLVVGPARLEGAASGAPEVAARDYDIVYVRAPRAGDHEITWQPDADSPNEVEPGADLMLLHPDDSEEVLVCCSLQCGGEGKCAVIDPYVSFDAETVYYALYHDQTDINEERSNNSRAGSDIFALALASRETTQLTFGEFTPNTGTGSWDEDNPVDNPGGNDLGHGIFNQGPAPVAGGRIAFTSTRNGFFPPSSRTQASFQLFVMDADGTNVELITPMSNNSVLHPVPLKDGRLMFSTGENFGLRNPRSWGVWAIYPDGRNWEPLVSAFEPRSFHFQTQLGDGDIVVGSYYPTVNDGHGTYVRFPPNAPDGVPRFFSERPIDNPELREINRFGFRDGYKLPFSPYGIRSITPFTHNDHSEAPEDPASPGDDWRRVGKFMHPAALPNGHLLTVWTPGPAHSVGPNQQFPNKVNIPYYDDGIYVIPRGEVVRDPSELLPVKNDPSYNEVYPRPVVPYVDIYGIDEPPSIPWLPPAEPRYAEELPEGTPYGLIGTSSLIRRGTNPGVGDDAFNRLGKFNSALFNSDNWFMQGADAGLYSDDDIWAIRLLILEPNPDRFYGPDRGLQFRNVANERIRILGEVPVRKFDGSGNPILDSEGNPDTSFLVKVPADTPFTFQTIDKDGMTLNMAQTWRQVRPGEVRNDCGGCHAHQLLPLDFEGTVASQDHYEILDLTKGTPLLTKNADGETIVRWEDEPVVNVEFLRDIRPILVAKCVRCHTRLNRDSPGKLALDDLDFVRTDPQTGETEVLQIGDWARFAQDWKANHGYPPVAGNREWNLWNLSRYVRAFQSRRSLLTWKIFGRRLDGWSNEDHPTETVPGDADTLPDGADRRDADLDYSGTIMPPPDNPHDIEPLTADEKMTFSRWIDLGTPVDLAAGEAGLGAGRYGWYADDVRPTIHISSPRPGFNDDSFGAIRFGVTDVYTGVDLASLSVKTSFGVAGRSPGSELADLALEVADSVYEIRLGEAAAEIRDGHVRVEVRDRQGNVHRVQRNFAVP